jgi:hypothetical protein
MVSAQFAVSMVHSLPAEGLVYSWQSTVGSLQFSAYRMYLPEIG